MGGSHSREDLDASGSDNEESEEETQEEEDWEDAVDKEGDKQETSLDEVDAKLRSLKLKYPSHNPNLKNPVKLYQYVCGNTSKAKWVYSEKLATYSFVRFSEADEDEVEENDDANSLWVLKIGSKVRAVVAAEMQLKTFGDQARVDFVSQGVWALKFFNREDYKAFVARYQDCLFENTYGMESTEENKIKIYGKDFIGWVKPEAADDSVWEDAEDRALRSPNSATPPRTSHDLREQFEEAAKGVEIQSLALGALDNSFLVSNSSVQVVRNSSLGLRGKGVQVSFDTGSSNFSYTTPKKSLLMKGETNMLLMSPCNENFRSKGLHQLDIETGKIVTEWKFEKDGTDITMRDITNDNKGAQLAPSGSTFLGLDDNRLCRWDMRDRSGIVQDLVGDNGPVLNWTQGHQFSKGTNFQCFATTGDGSIVVGSIDGKIRLYSSNAMRQAKTAFPGLGSPITHVDVTFDGRWILGTTDTYLILICTLFTDAAGNTKTGFSGRMGNRIPAPRLLKLTPLDSHLAGVNNKFRSAQFSWVTENGKQERHLVATVGRFSVIWNFQKVKDGSHECYRHQEGLKSCYCYNIALKDESIIDSRFMHEKFAVSDQPEAPLVVATPMKVRSFSISDKP